MRVAVEPLHDGQAAQHNEQKALPKQHATLEPNEPRQRPIGKSKIEKKFPFERQRELSEDFYF